MYKVSVFPFVLINIYVLCSYILSWKVGKGMGKKDFNQDSTLHFGERGIYFLPTTNLV